MRNKQTSTRIGWRDGFAVQIKCCYVMRMPPLFRSSLLGLATLTVLAACGDGSTTPTASVRGVAVTPNPATVTAGQSITLTATVDAASGVAQTVTWASSDATIAAVDATGRVTGIQAGNVTVVATSTADVSRKGAAAITVRSPGGVPAVTIAAIKQRNGPTSSPADLNNAFGQLDVLVNVETNGQTLKTVGATMMCPNNKTKTVSKDVSDLTPAAPVTLSFNTLAQTNGVPELINGACSLVATATTVSDVQGTTNTTAFTLNNTDGVVVTTTNSGASATDAHSQVWKSGNITVTATPVLYSGRALSTVAITLPGANVSTQVVTPAAGGAMATWSATATSGPNVSQLTLGGDLGASGLRKGVHPTVTLHDAQGNNVPAVQQINPLSESDVLIDNQSPVAPSNADLSKTALANHNWVTASYTFTGVGKYESNGDNNGVGETTDTVYYAATGAGAPQTLPAAGNQLTAAGTANCSTTGFTKITSAADIPNSPVGAGNTAYRARILEFDKLGNVRCTDLNDGAPAPGTALTTFGVDKSAPVASITGGPKNFEMRRALAQ